MSEKLFAMPLSAEERALISKLRLAQGPALPTKPYTVIKVQWRDAACELNPVLMRFPPEWYGEWGWSEGDDYGDAEHLRREIESFQTLSEAVDEDAAKQPAAPEPSARKGTREPTSDREREQLRQMREIYTRRFGKRPEEDDYPTDTGMSHESFAESYPNEVQYHYDGGWRDGAQAVLERWAEITGRTGEATRQQVAQELGVDE